MAAARPSGAVWGCLVPYSRRRGTITPTPRQQGVAEPEASHAAPHWSWARLLKRVFALEMAPCPFCHQGMLRSMAALTQAEVRRTMLRHLKRATDAPTLTPARVPSHVRLGRLSQAIARGLRSAVCAAEGWNTRCACAIPFAIAPLQPSHGALPETVSPGHPCGTPLSCAACPDRAAPCSA